ncbi:MAG: (2Fe-2S)-binding protein [Nitrospinales bacterium]
MEPTDIQSEEIICQCFQVSEKTIRACIKSGDLNKVEDVTKACEAGGGCHSCHILIELFIDQNNNPDLKTKPSFTPEGKPEKRGVFSKLFARF